MRIVGLSWRAFSLPLRSPFRMARTEILQRQGLLVRISTDAGVVGVGEASPHPALGSSALGEVLRAMERLAPSLLGAEVEALERCLGGGVPPALACALDTAACDALARRAGLGLADLLGGMSRPNVPVNALIGVDTDAEAALKAAAAREAGFSYVKVKVGRGGLAEERRRVAAVRAALGPGINLRLDAGGVWGPEEAISAIEALAEYGLEFVEQPVPPGRLEEMARVRRAVGVPIAADEDVTGMEAARRVLESGAADVLVVKPMVVGGLRAARRIMALALEAGIRVVVTTTIDAGVGTAAALHLAATLPPDSPACGLATGSLLAADIVGSPLTVRWGSMAVPHGPGLGVEVDEEALMRYSLGGGELT